MAPQDNIAILRQAIQAIKGSERSSSRKFYLLSTMVELCGQYSNFSRPDLVPRLRRLLDSNQNSVSP